MSTAKGKFIVFEGIDGAGKSTLIKLLAQHLKKQEVAVYTTFEPTYSPIGSIVRNIFGGRITADEKTIAALVLADRLDHIQHPTDGMLAKINSGTTVLADRYYLSSYAYHVPHVSLDWIINANSLSADMCKPDVHFFIDIPVEESLRRLSANRQELDMFESEERIRTVYHNYKTAIARVQNEETIVIINGHQPIEQVFEEVVRKIEELGVLG